ncbi:3-hydroxyacyl-ACP dehydratase FabZ [Elusimicrobiota bacterium]
MNRNEIESILPHRDPYLFIDEVKIEEAGKKGQGIKKLTGKEYFFEGHFPGRPVMPGVLIVEAIAQTAMVVLNRGDLRLKGVKKVKFRQTIQPGDTMKVDIELKEKNDSDCRINGEVYVDSNLVASGDIVIA